MSFTDILTRGLIANGGTVQYVIGVIVTAIVAYAAGNANFALIFGCDGESPKFLRVVAFACDIVVGIVAVFVGVLFMPADGFGCLAAVFCLIGHALPLWTRRRTGRCTDVLFGVMAALNPPVCLFILLIYIVTVSLSHYRALGAVVAACLFPIGHALVPFSMFVSSVGDVRSLVNYLMCRIAPIGIAFAVAFIYRDSINRMLRGTEPKTGAKTNNY